MYFLNFHFTILITLVIINLTTGTWMHSTGNWFYTISKTSIFFLFRMAHTILNLQISGNEVKDLKLPKEEEFWLKLSKECHPPKP